MPHLDDHTALSLEYLELLARGAAAEAYDRPGLLARADGADEATLAALERSRRLALGVRAELEERRRREAELSALYATAHDLAGLRDLDAVLRAIVRRARSLLGTEVAYLSLNDPVAGDTYMRVTEGSVAARFQQLRLGMGEGLGGLVAQTARPYVTADYFADDRFQHTDAIDAGVRDEGLVAILGVPLTLGSAVIGVLFAADRHTRVFGRDQIALLGSFAAHAAVALDTARLLAETREALSRLERANEIVRDRGLVIERAFDVHDRLTELVLRGGGVPEVTEAVAGVLGGEVTFTEHPPTRDGGTEDGDGGDGIGDGGGGDSARGRAVRHGRDWVAEVSAGGERLGALVLRGRPRLDPVDRRTLERAAMVTSLLLLARRSAGEAEQRVRGELLDDLLDAPDRAPGLVRERARRVGADLDAPHAVLAAHIGQAEHTEHTQHAEHAESAESTEHAASTDGSQGRRLWSAASHLAATSRGLAAARDGGAVLLLPLAPGESTTALARRTAADLTASLRVPVTVGASAVVASPAARAHAVGDGYAEALRCLEALRLLGRAGEGTAAGELGFLGLLLADGRDVEGFVRGTIGPVLAYDERRGTRLVATLQAYFATGMSPLRTKDVLHVHVNTVAQRIDRVGQLLGRDWQSPGRALEIQLALRLHTMTGPGGPLPDARGR
ncbi:helix-turn-helix domain-containing protein [Streptomyces sp. NPDC057638]|uniref:helix-turn-helix domain-containing protein n=1 Tax=Streptomyces sp. NPDC057638 TaxID=3346190 RepID=UPI00369C9F8B